jgi:hypothetical protein
VRDSLLLVAWMSIGGKSSRFLFGASVSAEHPSGMDMR